MKSKLNCTGNAQLRRGHEDILLNIRQELLIVKNCKAEVKPGFSDLLQPSQEAVRGGFIVGQTQVHSSQIPLEMLLPTADMARYFSYSYNSRN